MLKISNLFVSVEKKQILNGINLEIPSGEIHILMGPNGAGKSSLAMALAGHPLYKQQTNKDTKLQCDEKDITELTPDQRSKAGLFVSFQNPPAIPGVRLPRFLHLAKGGDFLTFYQLLKKRASELKLSDDFLKRSLNEDFSGGEKKKIELLQAMILQTKYLIFDEIDTGLDVDALKLVAKKINELKKTSGILLITHYQRLLKYLDFDKVWVIKEGKIIASGNKELAERIEKDGYTEIR